MWYTEWKLGFSRSKKEVTEQQWDGGEKAVLE